MDGYSRNKPLVFMCLTLALVLFSALSYAEQRQQLGHLEVHYSAFNSTFLQPDIATRYKLTRANRNALVNVTVLDNRHSHKPAQQVKLRGVARNLLGNKKTLNFIEIRSGESIYYLAELSFSNEETFIFDIEITHQGQTQALSFEQKFYAD